MCAQGLRLEHWRARRFRRLALPQPPPQRPWAASAHGGCGGRCSRGSALKGRADLPAGLDPCAPAQGRPQRGDSDSQKLGDSERDDWAR